MINWDNVFIAVALIVGLALGFVWGQEHRDDRNIFSCKERAIVKAGNTWYDCTNGRRKPPNVHD